MDFTIVMVSYVSEKTFNNVILFASFQYSVYFLLYICDHIISVGGFQKLKIAGSVCTNMKL